MPNFIEKISAGKKTYIIAEIGINHNGDISLAKEMIDAAKENNADCVKFQNFIADKYISCIAGKAAYQKQDTVKDKTQREIIQACQINRRQTIELIGYAAKKKIDFLSTPFEIWSFRLLKKLKLPAIKVSSCNLTNYPFLEEVAKSKLPVLLSTGMADLGEVIKAVEIFRRSGSPLLLFQCTSNYPSKSENANLKVIPMYKKLFGLPVGFSDHTVGSVAAIAAVALGAQAVEKHFTLSRTLPGIDQHASIEPKELKELVVSVRQCEKALGNTLKKITGEEENTKIALRRSLTAARDIAAGTVLSSQMIAVKRPGNGLNTEFIPYLIGKKTNKAIRKDDLFSLEDFLI